MVASTKSKSLAFALKVRMMGVDLKGCGRPLAGLQSLCRSPYLRGRTLGFYVKPHNFTSHKRLDI